LYFVAKTLYIVDRTTLATQWIVSGAAESNNKKLFSPPARKNFYENSRVRGVSALYALTCDLTRL
jgi:hypothetical protein